MEKRTEFSRDSIEVCRNCKSDGSIFAEDIHCNLVKIPCPICGGSGLVRKHIEGYVTIEPHVKPQKP